MLVTIDGEIILAAEGRGRRLRIRDGASAAQVRDAVTALLDKLSMRDRMGRRREILVETIDGEPASASPHVAALVDAGLRSQGRAMRFYPPVR
jgi:hypothetical protein